MYRRDNSVKASVLKYLGHLLQGHIRESSRRFFKSEPVATTDFTRH